ncbi:dTDP-4-dehydrorhamnose 3,5-epimerase [Marinomonas posidonica]|uniref:dTDP-4-dehydrorhamnose 3,5-epimerase n=1 Tax=Marinomonas posidonica (strain CECT 7376 / NCIMB 14433 / IVIA-Po-181) TaxID=491952 RepID=F6CZ87_MARPP|nr:dTDP-4-dehydrorhamnose 3,5-epimerase [Marinomonas posidonica]AEF53543.1 dTDP-4-dehydrorhamnose 3,5-epimerase [Marinomonas posidonica IVIA-Po-181]
MNIIETELEGVFEIKNKKFEDQRGVFIKTFHEGVFKEYGLEADFKESFFSISKKDVLRGMHFQMPPHDHEKLVYVTCGEILDVAVDIREDSLTYGQYFSTILSQENAKSLYIGKGYAHGFLTLSENATVVYLTSTVHSPENDTGIHWDSFGFDWHVKKPIVSERDASFQKISYAKIGS